MSKPGAPRKPKPAKPHILKRLMAGKRQMPWQWCPYCGLVALRNEPTAVALKQPCPGRDDE